MSTQTEDIQIRVREDGSRVVKRNIEQIGEASSKAGDAFNKMKGLIATVVTGAVVNQLRQLLDTYTQIQNQLRLTTTGQENLNAVYQELIAVSTRTRSSLEANVDLYSKLALATKDLGVSQKEVLQFTESLNKAIKLSGASGASAEGGLRQLAQGLASGTLRGDELNSVMENLPAVADVISKSLGITRGELRKLGAEGKISADTILTAFQKAREELDEKFKKTVPTIADGFQLLKNQLIVTVGEIDNATGSSSSLAQALGSVSEFIQQITPDIVSFARAVTGTLDPTDQMSDGMKVFATIIITVFYALKSLVTLIKNVVIGAFQTVGKTLGGLAAAVVAALKGEFSEAGNILKETFSDVGATTRDVVTTTRDELVTGTTQTIEQLAQVWDKGARLIQDRRDKAIGTVSDAKGPPNVKSGIDEKQLARQQRELQKVENALQSVLGQIAPLKGATMDYADAQDVLNKAVEKGLIDSDEQQYFLQRLELSYRDILDPLGTYLRQLDEQTKLLGMSARQREVEAQLSDITKDLLKQEIVLTNTETDALRNKLTALQELNDTVAAQDRLLGESVEMRRQFATESDAISKLLSDPSSGFTKGDAGIEVSDMLKSMGLDPTNLQVQQDAIVQQSANMYEQIKALRDQHLIGEREAAALELQVWQQTQEKRLAGAQTFLGNLAQLQNSKSKTAAKIGKSAAIAQTIIETYKSATSAYSAMAGIPYVGPALGVAAAAAAVAAGMANVQAIRAQPVGGFMKGGYTGNGAVDRVAGAVHGREYVMDARTTSRIGVNNLDALRSGQAEVSTRAGSKGNSAGGEWGGVSVKIENYGTSKDFSVEQISRDEIRVIARDEARTVTAKEAPRVVASEIGNANSAVSKAMARNTSTQRRR